MEKILKIATTIIVLSTIALLTSGATAAEDKTRWYPDYSRGFNMSICINTNTAPAPIEIVTYESQLACCETSLAGQSSGACLSSLPTSFLRQN